MTLLLSILTPGFCVASRAALQLIDRTILKKKDVDFHMCVFNNSFLPFLVACIITPNISQVLQIVLEPGIFFSGLGAQIAAYVFSASFRKMDVKNVVISSKLADLIIPFVTLAVASKFSMGHYAFSSASTVVFVPVVWSIFKRKEELHVNQSLQLVAALILQCSINEFFQVSKFATSLNDFLCMMTAILFWRTFFVSGSLLMKKEKVFTDKKIPILSLSLRAVLAFLSQSAFFLSITRYSSEMTWPILNTAPLITCLTAHFILGETINRSQILVFILFITLSLLYIWSRL